MLKRDIFSFFEADSRARGRSDSQCEARV